MKPIELGVLSGPGPGDVAFIMFLLRASSRALPLPAAGPFGADARRPLATKCPWVLRRWLLWRLRPRAGLLRTVAPKS